MGTRNGKHPPRTHRIRKTPEAVEEKRQRPTGRTRGNGRAGGLAYPTRVRVSGSPSGWIKTSFANPKVSIAPSMDFPSSKEKRTHSSP